MKKDNLNNFITDVLAIEATKAKEAGTIGYMAWMLVQATMPHKKVDGNEFVRNNGAFSLSILAPSKIGLPYGTIPRLLMAWLTKEAVLKKSREILLGDSLSDFMQELGLSPTGGKWGTITRLREQSKRLFSSSVSCSYKDDNYDGERGFRISDAYDLWWSPKHADEPLFGSSIRLSENFFNGIITNPIPVDMRVLKHLSRSPLALDIYCWLTYRFSYLKKPTTILWQVLLAQFGCGYQDNPQGRRDFKKAFLRELKKIYLVYPDMNIDHSENWLILNPSNTHIPKLKFYK